MPDTKITALAAITTVAPSNDLFPIVDVSDNSMAASGTTKNITVNQLLGAGGTATLASATITGDMTVKTNVLKVDTVNNRVGVNTASPLTNLHVGSGAGLTGLGVGLSRGATANFFEAFDGTKTFIGGTDSANAGVKVGSLSNHSVFLVCNNITQLQIDPLGVFSFTDGAGGTRMTLNATGLGVGGSPTSKLSIFAGADGDVGFFRGGSTRQVQIGTSATAGYLNTDNGSAGLEIRTQGTARAYFDNSGNVGIGVTPSAWATYKAVSVGGIGASVFGLGTSQAGIAQGAFFNNGAGSGWAYSATSQVPTYYLQINGENIWNIAASGTAGAQITAWTPAMKLDASGNLLVGTTSSPLASRVSVGVTSGQPDAFVIRNSAATAGLYWRLAYINSANTFHILNQSGVGVYLTDGATSWTGTSDERLKDIIEPISNAIAKVGSLRSVIGKFKTDSEGTRRSFLIAQDVQAVLPEAVDTTNADAFGVRYSEVIPLLVAAIKELTARVQTLETR